MILRLGKIILNGKGILFLLNNLSLATTGWLSGGASAFSSGRDPRILGSRPELKADAPPLSHPVVARDKLLRRNSIPLPFRIILPSLSIKLTETDYR